MLSFSLTKSFRALSLRPLLLAGFATMMSPALGHASGHEYFPLVSCAAKGITLQAALKSASADDDSGECASAIFNDSPYANHEVLVLEFLGRDLPISGARTYRLTTSYWGGTGTDIVIFDRTCTYVCSENLESE